MHEVECAVKGVRWANNRAVPRVAYDGPCGSEIASSPMVNVSGGSIVQVSVWAKLASYSGPSGQMPQITLMTFDKEGDHCLDAFYSGAGSILGGAKEAAWTFTAAWQEYRATISVQPNATHLSLYSALAVLSVVELDTSLRNVIRTNATAIEVRPTAAAAAAPRYVEGTDYTVEEPTVVNSAGHAVRQKDNHLLCNLSALKPYVIKRVEGGRIAPGAEV
jgi:hypothetical protein